MSHYSKLSLYIEDICPSYTKIQNELEWREACSSSHPLTHASMQLTLNEELNHEEVFQVLQKVLEEMAKRAEIENAFLEEMEEDALKMEFIEELMKILNSQKILSTRKVDAIKDRLFTFIHHEGKPALKRLFCKLLLRVQRVPCHRTFAFFKHHHKPVHLALKSMRSSSYTPYHH